MNQGTRQQARTLATERWQQHFAFDLDVETWARLFADFDGRDILEAINVTKRTTRSTKPEVLYGHFERCLQGLNEKRNPTWPPSDMIQN